MIEETAQADGFLSAIVAPAAKKPAAKKKAKKKPAAKKAAAKKPAAKKAGRPKKAKKVAAKKPAAKKAAKKTTAKKATAKKKPAAKKAVKKTVKKAAAKKPAAKKKAVKKTAKKAAAKKPAAKKAVKKTAKKAAKKPAAKKVKKAGRPKKSVKKPNDGAAVNLKAFTTTASSKTEQTSPSVKKGLETLGSSFLSYAQDQLQETVQTAQQLMNCRSLEDVATVQTQFVRQSFDRLVKQASKMAQTTANMAKDASGPLSDRLERLMNTKSAA